MYIICTAKYVCTLFEQQMFVGTRQCDQMLNRKDPKLFHKLPNKQSQQFLLRRVCISKQPKKSIYIWETLGEKLSPRSLKNRPIWSHWTTRSCYCVLVLASHTILHFKIINYHFTQWPILHRFFDRNLRLCSRNKGKSLVRCDSRIDYNTTVEQ